MKMKYFASQDVDVRFIEEPIGKKIILSQKMKTGILENVFWKNDYKGQQILKAISKSEDVEKTCRCN